MLPKNHCISLRLEHSVLTVSESEEKALWCSISAAKSGRKEINDFDIRKTFSGLHKYPK